MAITKPKAQSDPASDRETLENCSKDELQQTIHQMRTEKKQIEESHMKAVVEQRGLFLKEREKTHTLEAQLKVT